jgi:SPP1 family predicted phage head-tail adaptor
MAYDKPITIQIQDPDTEAWADRLRLHAEVNKTGGGTSFNAGADQYRASLTFKVRYTRKLEDIINGPQPFRVIYRGRTYKVVDCDDFMERHREVKLVGELYV